MRLRHTPGSICTSVPQSHSCLRGAQLTQGYSISGFRPDFSAGCGCSYLFFLTTLAGVLLTFSPVSHPEFLCSFFSPQGHTKGVLVKLACAQRMWRGLGTTASRNQHSIGTILIIISSLLKIKFNLQSGYNIYRICYFKASFHVSVNYFCVCSLSSTTADYSGCLEYNLKSLGARDFNNCISCSNFFSFLTSYCMVSSILTF